MKTATTIILMILLMVSLSLSLWFYTERSNLGITVSDGVIATSEIGANPQLQQESLGLTATVSVQCSFNRSVSQGITISDSVTVAVERASY